jgi:hypothetical protein
LCADLTRHFGSQQIFMAIFSVEPGEDFVERITTAVDSSNVLVVVIGTDWLMISDEKGRRLDDPKDYVRLEIVTALNQSIRIIPVLINGATMPREADLPAEIKNLARYNAFEISNKRWDYDVGLLIETIEKAVRGPAWPPTTRVIVGSVAIAVLFIVGIGLWINKSPIQVNSADSTQASSPSPEVTASKPVVSPTPNKEKSPAKDGSPTPQASPTTPKDQEPDSGQLEAPWDSISRAARDLFPGRHIEDVTKNGDPVCNLGVCRQMVYVVLPDSARSNHREPVVVTYHQRNGHWQVSAQRINQNH